MASNKCSDSHDFDIRSQSQFSVRIRLMYFCIFNDNQTLIRSANPIHAGLPRHIIDRHHHHHQCTMYALCGTMLCLLVAPRDVGALRAARIFVIVLYILFRFIWLTWSIFLRTKTTNRQNLNAKKPKCKKSPTETDAHRTAERTHTKNYLWFETRKLTRRPRDRNIYHAACCCCVCFSLFVSIGMCSANNDDEMNVRSTSTQHQPL